LAAECWNSSRVDAFVNEVSDKLEDKILLVLDDYHHLDSSQAIRKAVDRLAQCLPDLIHLVITTRTMPNLSITRLKSKGLIGIIDRCDLLFSPQEIERLFAEVFHHPLPPELIDQIHKKTEGWITALQLIQQSFDQISSGGLPKKEAEIAMALERSDMEIFDYFAQEVLRFEEPQARLLLGQASLLERIDPEACDRIFGAQNSRQKFSDLSRRNIFITAIWEAGGEQEYRLHPLFRSFLKRWLTNQIGAEGIRQLHLECARHFAERARWELAAHHYAEASAYAELADLLVQHGADLMRAGRFELIKRSFDGLPQDLLDSRPGALIARAEVAPPLRPSASTGGISYRSSTTIGSSKCKATTAICT
jgi:LuxR family maltose regulon positive regulatory protein